MAIVKCKRGHFYDDSKHSVCPLCEKSEIEIYPNWPPDNKGMNLTVRPIPDDEGKTISVYESEKKDNPVTGWIVCITGPERGRDYRLYAGFNRIGRNPEADIFIGSDDKVSGKCHCSVVYDYKKNRFLLVPGKDSLTYYGKEEALLEKPVTLYTGERFHIGDSVFEFIPFCREGFSWEEYEEK